MDCWIERVIWETDYEKEDFEEVLFPISYRVYILHIYIIYHSIFQSGLFALSSCNAFAN